MVTTPRDEIRQSIRQGFYASSLNRIISLAEQLFYSRPALYGSLILICRSLLEEQDPEQGTTPHRLQQVNQALQQSMLKVLDAEFDPPAHLIAALHDLHHSWFSLF